MTHLSLELSTKLKVELINGVARICQVLMPLWHRTIMETDADFGGIAGTTTFLFLNLSQLLSLTDRMCLRAGVIQCHAVARCVSKGFRWIQKACPQPFQCGTVETHVSLRWVLTNVS